MPTRGEDSDRRPPNPSRGKTPEGDNAMAGAGPYGSARPSTPPDRPADADDIQGEAARIGSMDRDAGVDESGADATAGGEYVDDSGSGSRDRHA